MRREPDAFTLLELLIAAALVTVLATALVATLSMVAQTREQAQSSETMRQWGAALAAYVAENNGDLPRRGQGMQPVTQLDRPEDWFNALPPYLGMPGYGALVSTGRRPRQDERSIFVRPGAKDPGAAAFLSFAMNMNLSPWNLPSPTKLAQVEQIALTVFLAESSGPYASTYPSTRAYSCQAPHRGQGNVLFLDGHVAAFSAAYLGVGSGDPGRADVRWLTGTISDSQAASYR